MPNLFKAIELYKYILTVVMQSLEVTVKYL